MREILQLRRETIQIYLDTNEDSQRTMDKVLIRLNGGTTPEEKRTVAYCVHKKSELVAEAARIREGIDPITGKQVGYPLFQ